MCRCCKIDKVTSAEIAFAIFIAKHNLSMAVGDEFGLLAKKIVVYWCTDIHTPDIHPPDSRPPDNRPPDVSIEMRLKF